MADETYYKTKIHILVGVTGSVAAIKLPTLVEKLLEIPKVCTFLRLYLKMRYYLIISHSFCCREIDY